MRGRRLESQSVPYRLCLFVFSVVICACGVYSTEIMGGHTYRPHLLLVLTLLVDIYSVLIGNLYLSTGGPTPPPIFLLEMVDICKTPHLLFVSAPQRVMHLPTEIVGHTVGRCKTARGVFREPLTQQLNNPKTYITSFFSLLPCK